MPENQKKTRRVSEPSSKKRRSSKKRNTEDGPSAEPSLLERYFPMVENLVVFLFNSTKWLKSTRLYIKREVNYRAGLLARSVSLFVCAMVFLAGSMVFLLWGSYLYLQQLLHDPVLPAFIIFGASLLLAVFLILLTVNSFGKITESREESLDD